MLKTFMRNFVAVALITGFVIGAVAYAVLDFITDGG